MAAPQVFKVLTEFKFETGQAIVSSGKLQQSVDNISKSADAALFSLKRLGLGLVADFGLGASSLLGILGQALKTSENFTKNQLTISNLLSANLQNLTGEVNTFAERLMVSKNILKDIAKDAQKFGLDEAQLAATTKLTAGFLLPKGLAGDNFSGARDLSRNFLKSSPSLGINPGLAEGQLLRAIEGSASMGDTLFRRLAAETAVFQKELAGAENAAKAFNKLPLKRRFELISTGLGQFASDMDVLNAQATQFDRLFTRLRNTFTGLDGILKPLGDVLAGPIKKAFEDLLKILDNEGRTIIQQLSELIKPLVSDLRGFVINLLQLRELGNDLRSASFVTSIIGLAAVLLPFLGKLGFIGRFIGPALAFVGKGLGFLARGLFLLGPVFGFLISSVVKFLPILAIITTLFQLISRAIAIAKVQDALIIPKLLGELATVLNTLRATLEVAFEPFFRIFNAAAEGIAPVFRLSNLLVLFVGIMKKLSEVVLLSLAGIQGAIFAILQVLDNLKAGKFTDITAGVGKAFDAGAESFFEAVNRKTQNPETGETAVASNVTNINKVEIKNEFKEQFEPDRIAFSLKDQLLKAAQNPTAAKGKGFALTGLGR